MENVMSVKATYKPILAVSIIVAWNVSTLCGQSPSNAHQATFHAKGANVIELSFANQGEIEYAGAAISRDGVEFHPIEGVVASMWSGPSDCEAVIVLIECPRMGTCNFVFDSPGTYYLKSGLKFRNEHKPSVVFDRAVTVLPTTHADQGFLDELSDPDLLRHLFGEDFFERETDAGRERILSPEAADFRALTIIRELLEATREKVTWEIFAGPKWPEERIRFWGDSLSELAKEFPDSSYAPYAAYYAGCCYSAMGYNRMVKAIRANRVPGKHKDLVADAKLCRDLAKKDADCAYATEMFAFAAERADAYLRPRALYQQASLRVPYGDFDGVDRFLDQAMEAAPGKGTIETMVTKFRADIAKGRKDLARQKESKSP